MNVIYKALLNQPVPPHGPAFGYQLDELCGAVFVVAAVNDINLCQTTLRTNTASVRRQTKHERKLNLRLFLASRPPKPLDKARL